MIIQTEQFKDVASTILLALDNTTANLELKAKDHKLYLSVTNREYYVSKWFEIESDEEFRAVVEAKLFLDLVSQITTETFELVVSENVLSLKAGKSNYKLAMIYDNDHLVELPIIKIDNKTVEMNISNDILKSILTVNSREISKAKNLDVNELQRLYYVDETGCFTFTTGACLNRFTLEKPVKLLLNERIVKLFKLFKTDVYFSFGHDMRADGIQQDKATFETVDTYVAALLTCDNVLINKIQGPCNATKSFIDEKYANHIVISATTLSAALARLILFTKNSLASAKSAFIPAEVVFHPTEISITDTLGNTEVVGIENDSYVEDNYSMIINIADLKLAVDNYKNEHITINCGNHRSVVISCGAISNLVPEGKKA